MKVFLNELYKVFIKRKYIIILIILFACESVSLCVSLSKSTVMDTDSLAVYNQYMNEFSGELTPEKIRKIEDIIETTRRSDALKNEIRNEYISGEITLDEYKSGLKRIREETKGEEGFFSFVSAYYNAVNSDITLADSHLWDVLFGNGGIDFFLVFSIILFIVLLTVYDDETGTNQLKYTLKNGKSVFISTQIVSAILVTVLVSELVFTGRFLIAKLFFGLDGMENPLNFSEIFSLTPWAVTIFEGYLFISCIKTVGCVYLAVLTMMIGQLCKNSLHTIFAGVVAVYIPGYLLTDLWDKYMLAIPSSLLSGNGYFSMIEKCSIISSDTGDTMIKSFSPAQLSAYFSVVLMVIIALCVLNELLWVRRKAVR